MMLKSERDQLNSVAVAIPCYNEGVTIAKVVADFKAALPEASIHVFDNNSSDDSIALAEKAGAQVHRVVPQGKGHVVRAIFDVLEEDVILLVDGDDTYPADAAPTLLEPVLAGKADMVVGERMASASDDNMKPMHQFGNRVIVGLVNSLFGVRHGDILSGYRAFNRRFVESVPVLTAGFEVETEITLQALAEGLQVVEVPIQYRSRPEESESKLRPFSDGYRIFLTIAILLRDHRPLWLFGYISGFFWLTAALAGGLRMLNYLNLTHLSSSLLAGIVLLCVPTGMITLGIGLTLNAINTRFQEVKQFLRRHREL